MDVPDRPDHAAPPAVEPTTTPTDRVERVRRAAELWKGQLVDLGGRNTLLYYRDLKQGTLDLSPDSGADQVAVSSLLGSRTVRLSTLFTDAEALAAAAKRARTVSAKAREMFEERGLRTLYVGWGMATWTNLKGQATPAAPLLMASVTLTSRGAGAEDFDLALSDDFEVNPTFLHMLGADFSVSLNPDELVDLLDDDAVGAPDPTPLFARIQKACGELPGFAITPRVVIGNFSYAKLSMVRDLENALEELVSHELIAALAGDAEAQSAIRGKHVSVALSDPNFVPLKDEFLVLDADASQNFAINSVVAEKDLVIDGPPGTGKSQTIANLIASLTARGKKVLFVAEKRAAIDAVLTRLDKKGLRDLVLDLHDGVGNRRKFAEELARSLAAAAAIPAPTLDGLSAQEKRRGKLIDHAEAIHEDRTPWGVSVYAAQSAVLGTPPFLRTELRLDSVALQSLNEQAAPTIRGDLEEFAELGGPEELWGGHPSPWAGAIERGTIASASSVTSASEMVRRLDGETIPSLIRDLNSAAEGIGLLPAGSLASWAEVIDLWQRVEKTLGNFDAAIYQADLPNVVADLAPAAKGALGRSWASLYNGRYRKAKKQVRSLARLDKMRAPELLHGVADAKTELARWRRFADGPSMPSSPGGGDALLGRFTQLGAELDTLAGWTGIVHVQSMTAGELLDITADLRAQQDVLQKLPRLTELRGRLMAASLEDVIQHIGERRLSADDAIALFDHVWHASILDSIANSDRAIATFRRESHDRVARDFIRGDHDHQEDTPMRVLRAAAEAAVRARTAHPEQEQVILRQSKLKRKHLPVRDLFQIAPDVLTAMKPCWAMSPLVVSQVLPAQADLFDVVIFDEASQIQPADAVGSLLRGRQAVVAGDPRQLPPTTFFLSSDDGGGDGRDAAITADLESLLDAMTILLPPPVGTRTLNWHYRSRDERLIAFSNAQPTLYDWSLTTFPGTDGGECLRHELVPFVAGTAGQEESAALEVTTVVQLVLEHAREHPDESLGVIAMGIKHADRITEALRRTRLNHPEQDPYFGEDTDEPFFIKNLERVQGDERDAIILTIGYGKTSDGRMLYRFGPINVQGGERRLNVAVTRARNRMTVVSSFGASEMDPTRLRSAGPQMLQRFLQYAESGGANLGHLAKRKPDLNPFERDVLNALTAAGIPLVPQVGTSGYWIDFAAQHPIRRGEMVLAIETDGARYHSTPTARDRDRLRQEHLERLGWHFHRIWSTSWFQNREAEIALALEAYQTAIHRADGGGPSAATHRPTPAGSGPVIRERDPRPRVPRGLSVGDYTHRQLVSIVRWITSDTLLRTDDALLQDLMEDLQFQRRGAKIVDAITAAIREVRGQSR